MTPIQAAFAALVMIYHPPLPCLAPGEAYSSEFVTSACQMYAEPGKMAESCWVPITHVAVLPTSCKDTGIDDHYCNVLAYHEANRQIEQVCMGHHFTQAEPPSVLYAERFAP